MLNSARFNRETISWSLYDWANSAFTTTVMAGFFPLFFKLYWAKDLEAAKSTSLLGDGNAFGGLVIAALSPLLGAIADRGSYKKRFLFLFTLVGCAATGALYLPPEGNWQYALWCYIVAVLGFGGVQSFNDALLVSVAKDEDSDFVSSFAFALGYLGGGLLFFVNVLMFQKPEWFGIPDKPTAVKLSFLSVALWWAVFSIPVFVFVREARPAHVEPPLRAAVSGVKQLIETVRHVGRYRQASLFLLAYWFYIDGVHTIVRMAVDYGVSLNFREGTLITALLITQFVGFPAAIGFGWLGERIGTQRALFIAIGVYVAVTIFGYFMTRESQFYGLAVSIGLVQGGAQSLSRSLFSRMTPKDKAAEFFGFYNMIGKFSAVLGPFMVARVTGLTGETRYGILSLLVLFLLGAALFYFVDEKKGVAQAQAD